MPVHLSWADSTLAPNTFLFVLSLRSDLTVIFLLFYPRFYDVLLGYKQQLVQAMDIF